MRWMVTGARGMLGTDLVDLLVARGEDVTALGRVDLDLSDADAVRERVAGHDVVVNCAAWTAVDDAEHREAEAFEVNAVVPALLARAARLHRARLVQVSTDYVFDGEASAPYAEDAPIRPRSAYGRTKAAGEWAVRSEAPDALIVRTAWLYGAHGACFPRTIDRLLRERGTVTVVKDQRGQPTWTVDVARVLVDLVLADAPAGAYHATAQGEASWWDFARAVAAARGLDPEAVTPTTSDAFVRPAARPTYSALGHDALVAAGVDVPGDWLERWAIAASATLGS